VRRRRPLDEPTTGLDPYGRLALWQVLASLTARGTSVLLTTQYIEEAERLAGRIVIIDRGAVIASGTPGQLRAQAGRDRLELQSPPGQDPRQLAAALSALGTGEPAIDEAAGRVVLPVADGPGILPEVAARLAAVGLQVSGLALRRPTLEEAFLALTGRTRSPQHDASGPPAATSLPAHGTPGAP
jgi:ABC-type multidrug transport system ATPase subunit